MIIISFVITFKEISSNTQMTVKFPSDAKNVLHCVWWQCFLFLTTLNIAFGLVSLYSLNLQKSPHFFFLLKSPH